MGRVGNWPSARYVFGESGAGSDRGAAMHLYQEHGEAVVEATALADAAAVIVDGRDDAAKGAAGETRVRQRARQRGVPGGAEAGGTRMGAELVGGLLG